MNCCKKENSNRSYLKKDGTDGFEPLPSKNVISNMSMIYLYMYICISEYIIYIYIRVCKHAFICSWNPFLPFRLFPRRFSRSSLGMVSFQFFGEKNHLRLREIIFFAEPDILLTVDGSEIPNNHLGCINPGKLWDIYHINWCRISSINRMTEQEHLHNSCGCF